MLWKVVDGGLQNVFKCPVFKSAFKSGNSHLFNIALKNRNKRLQSVYKSPVFYSVLKSGDDGLQNVYKSPVFYSDLKSGDDGLRNVF